MLDPQSGDAVGPGLAGQLAEKPCEGAAAHPQFGSDPVEAGGFEEPVGEFGEIAFDRAAVAALDQAGFPKRAEGYDEVGVALGSFTAGVHASAEYLQTYLQQGPASAPALLFSNTVGNAPASICGLEFALRGPNVTLTHKEASGLAAIEFGAHLIRRGKSPAMLAGGADVLESSFYRVHDWFRVLAPDPEPCRPFDAHREGFLLGEGAFLFVLEDAAHAATRSAPVLGTILGTATTGSSDRLNAWPASPDSLVRVIRQALARAGVPPDAIDVVYASANGSPGLDGIEAAALGLVFGVRPVAVTAIKGAIGESGAAGAASLAAVLLLAPRRVVPPTVGLRQPGAGAPAGLSAAPQPLRGPLALVTSVGSGGTHVALFVRAGDAAGAW
jgi:3-oxoacyl-(acyl-carrier-protein) synthase